MRLVDDDRTCLLKASTARSNHPLLYLTISLSDSFAKYKI